jgi:hypothetical protein
VRRLWPLVLNLSKDGVPVRWFDKLTTNGAFSYTLREAELVERKDADMETDYKQVALKIIESMLDDVPLEDIMYELYFRQCIDRGLTELE